MRYRQQKNYGEKHLKESIRTVRDFKKGRFFGFRREYCEIAMELKGAFALYAYMTTWVTTDTCTHKTWKKKIVPYFMEGHLPFCKNLTSIREELKIPEKDRMKITRFTKKLEEKGLIKNIGEEWVGNSFRPAKVYCLGDWERGEDDKIERIYLLDRLVGLV